MYGVIYMYVYMYLIWSPGIVYCSPEKIKERGKEREREKEREGGERERGEQRERLKGNINSQFHTFTHVHVIRTDYYVV